MLRLVHSGTPERTPPGAGWLTAVAILQLVMGLLWLFVVARGLLRDVLDDPREVRQYAFFGAYALAQIVAGAFLLRRRRWAWWLSAALGLLTFTLGLVGGAPAAVMVGGLALYCLRAGRTALG